MRISDSNRRRSGRLLVALQFGLLAVLGLLGADALAAGSVANGAWWVLGLGLALGSWALACNRPGNFNIQPTPREGGHLVQSGPYRWIRHPMYSAVLLVAVALAWAAGGAGAWLALALLTAVLTVKARLEERWMCARHEGYSAYQRRSRRFVPWLF